MKSWQKSGLYCVQAQTASGPFLPDFYVFSNSQAQRHRVWAGRRAVLYWIVGYVTILYPLNTMVVVRLDCFVFSDCEPELNPQRRGCQTCLSDLKLFLLQKPAVVGWRTVWDGLTSDLQGRALNLHLSESFNDWRGIPKFH